MGQRSSFIFLLGLSAVVAFSPLQQPTAVRRCTVRYATNENIPAATPETPRRRRNLRNFWRRTSKVLLNDYSGTDQHEQQERISQLEARVATLEAELKISSDTRAQEQPEPTIGRDADTPLVSVCSAVPRLLLGMYYCCIFKMCYVRSAGN